MSKEIIDSWGGENNKYLIKNYPDEVRSFVGSLGNKFKIVKSSSIIDKLENKYMDEGGGTGDNGIDLRKEDVGEGVLLNIELGSKEYIGNGYGYYGTDWYQVL